MADYRIEPWEDDRAYVQTALFAATMANLLGSKRGGAFKVEDFMPDFDHPVRRQSPKDMLIIFEQFAAVHNRSHKGANNRQP